MKTARNEFDRSSFTRPGELRDLFDDACPDELAEAIAVLAQMRASCAGLSGLESVRHERRRLELIAELHRLNLLCLEHSGRPVRTHADVEAVIDDGAPSLSTFCRWFGSLERALYEARLLEVPYPEAISAMVVRRPRGQVQLTAEQCEAAFAAMVDELNGVLPTEMQLYVMRAGQNPRTQPGVNRLLSVDGKRASLVNVHVRAVERICANPEQFPRAYRVWSKIPKSRREQVVRGRSAA